MNGIGRCKPQYANGVSMKQTLIAMLSIFMAFILSACGGSSTGSTNSNLVPLSCTGTNCGGAQLSLTDAQGDFLTYTVDVVSLKLNRIDGTTVETIPMSTKVDFATLVNLSEVIGNGQVPAGNYSSASITLDYSNANIVVDDGSASGLAVSAIDSNGNPITQITLNVQLDGSNRLVISHGRTSHLSLDFNLLASNTVDTTAAKVTVNPVLVASLVPPASKPFRIRGPLVSVDTAAASYTVNVRPFHNNKGEGGQQVVSTTNSTTYSIDGVTYSGSAGLTQLSSVAPGALVVAYGQISTSDHSFTATNVLAGTSVVQPHQDSIEGDVIARTGNTLTIRGVTFSREVSGSNETEPDYAYQRGDVTATIGEGTQVTKDGHTGALTIADISVGQHVVLFGTATITGSGSSSSSSSSSSSLPPIVPMFAQLYPQNSIVTLDATAGRARLMASSMWGIVTSKAIGTITINLKALDGRTPSDFNFSGTGLSSATDANPASYIVNTGNLDLTDVNPGTAVRVIGFVEPFGSVAQGADFDAETLVNFTATEGRLLIQFARPGLVSPFTSLDNSGLLVSQSVLASSPFHTLMIGPQAVDVSLQPAGLLITSSTSPAAGSFVINHRASRRLESFDTFTDFVAGLGAGLNGTIMDQSVAAEGAYNSTSGVFVANQIITSLND